MNVEPVTGSMSYLMITEMNHERTLNGRTEVNDQEVNTAIFKPTTRLNSGENSCVAQRTNKHSFTNVISYRLE